MKSSFSLLKGKGSLCLCKSEGGVLGGQHLSTACVADGHCLCLGVDSRFCTENLRGLDDSSQGKADPGVDLLD